MDDHVRKLAESNTNTAFSAFHSTDRLLISFWLFLSALSVLLHARLPQWWWMPVANAVIFFVLWGIARADQSSNSRILRCVHDWSAFPLVIFTFKQIYYLVRPMHPGRDYDQLLIWLDRALFGVDPTRWMASFAQPFLTELLQIAYSLFYAIFLIIGIELYRNRDASGFRFFRFSIVYGFLLSYVGYFALPSVGPRFTLHDFANIDNDLPGLLVTPALRWFVNIFESIHGGMSSSAALAVAQRDVFPSGHTMLTIVAVALAYRYRLHVRRYMLGIGILLIIGTVYLRYHYVVDLIAGASLGVFCLLTSSRVYLLFGRDASPRQRTSR